MSAGAARDLSTETEALRLHSVLIAAVLLLLVLWLHLLSALFAGLAGYALYRRVRAFTGPMHGDWHIRAVRWFAC